MLATRLGIKGADLVKEEYRRADAVRLLPIRGEVEFRDVTFGYDKAKPVLKDVSVHVQPGEMIGVRLKSSGIGPTERCCFTAISWTGAWARPMGWCVRSM